MLANIRVRENGESRFLCELDLMKFTKKTGAGKNE